MACDPATVVCELAKIADAMERSGGNQTRSFLTTLLATLTGASISGLIAILIFRGGRRARYEERVDEGLISLMDAITDYLDKSLAYQLAKKKGVPGSEAPLVFKPIVAVNRLHITARSRDRAIVLRAHNVILSGAAINEDERHRLFTEVSDALTAWRLKLVDRKKSLTRLDELVEQGRVAQSAKVPDGEPKAN